MMGVVHSMDDAQVQRISNALKGSADAIQGINNKFDEVDGHLQNVQSFNKKINTKIEGTVDAFDRFDSTFDARVENVLVAVESASLELTKALEQTLETIQRFDVRRELNQLPKSFIPLTIPLILLLIELAVSNAYLGILLSSIPEVRNRYSNYLLANATAVLFGLTLSLVWLMFYRLWLSYKTHYPGSFREDDSSFVPRSPPPLRRMSTAEIQAELTRRSTTPRGHSEDTLPMPSGDGDEAPCVHMEEESAAAADLDGQQGLDLQQQPPPQPPRSRSEPNLQSLSRDAGIPTDAPADSRDTEDGDGDGDLAEVPVDVRRSSNRRPKRTQSATSSLQSQPFSARSCSSDPITGRRRGSLRGEVSLLLQKKRAEAMARGESSGRAGSKGTWHSGSRQKPRDGDTWCQAGSKDPPTQKKSKPAWKWSAPLSVEVLWGGNRS